MCGGAACGRLKSCIVHLSTERPRHCVTSNWLPSLTTQPSQPRPGHQRTRLLAGAHFSVLEHWLGIGGRYESKKKNAVLYLTRKEQPPLEQ